MVVKSSRFPNQWVQFNLEAGTFRSEYAGLCELLLYVMHYYLTHSPEYYVTFFKIRAAKSSYSKWTANYSMCSKNREVNHLVMRLHSYYVCNTHDMSRICLDRPTLQSATQVMSVFYEWNFCLCRWSRTPVAHFGSLGPVNARQFAKTVDRDWMRPSKIIKRGFQKELFELSGRGCGSGFWGLGSDAGFTLPACPVIVDVVSREGRWKGNLIPPADAALQDKAGDTTASLLDKQKRCHWHIQFEYLMTSRYSMHYHFAVNRDLKVVCRKMYFLCYLK